MTASLALKPWEVAAGDRILGTDLIAAGPGRFTGDGPAPGVDGLHYSVPLTDGRTVPYTAASTVRVLREEN